MPIPSFSSQAFIEIALNYNVLRFGEFELKSGRMSPYFFNAGLLATGEMLALLANGYADVLAEQTATPQKAVSAQNNLVIFGAAYKGIPFVAATAQALWNNHKINAEWGYNRKEIKAHGEGGRLVGADLQGKSVWILDDVITAGTAMREVIALLNEVDATVAGIIVALDRKEKGQNEQSAIGELAAQLQVPVIALIDIDDIITYLDKQGNVKQGNVKQGNVKSNIESLSKMRQYRKQYGI